MERTWKPKAAGILCIIVGAVFVVPGIVLLPYMWLGAFVIIIPGIMPIVGGIYALKRRRWRLALAGSVLTLPSCVILGIYGIIAFIAGIADNMDVKLDDLTPLVIGFIVGVAILAILGILAIIFVNMGKREFE
jgi:hypothetical protein